MSDVAQKKLEKFFSRYKKKKLKKGQIIIKPNDPIRNIYFIVSGHVRLYTVSLEGKEMTLHAFHSYSFFPFIYTLDKSDNKYYFEAMTPVELYFAPTHKVIDYIHSHPDILLDFATRLSSGIIGLLDKIEHIMHEHATIKVISLLLYLTKHYGRPSAKKPNQVTLEFSHHELASWVGLQRETVSRQLEKLQKQKLVTNKNHAIVIEDLQKLKRLSVLSN